MLKCSLSSEDKRRVSVCNYNHHHMSIHPDRTMAEHDLIYMVSGEWEIWQGDIPYLLREGDILFLSAGHHHYGVKPCSEDVRTIYVHLCALEGDRCQNDLSVSENEFLFPMHFHIPSASPLPLLLKQMVSAYWQQNIYASEQASAYLSLALCEMSSLASENAGLVSHEVLVSRLLQTIESTPDRFFSVEEMCKLINVSRKTLHNYFMEVTGLSPHAYQLDWKLNCAKKLLEEKPEIPLGDLGGLLGFCDEYHFSKMFKLKFSISPRKYAKYITALGGEQLNPNEYHEV